MVKIQFLKSFFELLNFIGMECLFFPGFLEIESNDSNDHAEKKLLKNTLINTKKNLLTP